MDFITQLQLISLFFLFFLAAIFSLAETSITGMSRIKIAANIKNNHPKAKYLKVWITDPNKIPAWSTKSNKLDFLSGRPTFMSAAPHAAGGVFNKAHVGIVAEKGPEAIIPLSKMGMFGGVTIINNIHGSVISQKDLSLQVRNDIAQLLRRKGLSTAILGV